MTDRAGARLVRRPLGWDLAPVEALRLVRSDAHPVALTGSWAGGCDVVGSEPVLVREPPQQLDDVLDSPCPPGAVNSGPQVNNAAPKVSPPLTVERTFSAMSNPSPTLRTVVTPL